ncbi:MAG: family 78 glycoside hydrolase catalytic domain, partial [Clostridia bacterium]|nr:family 78 glycoside hydrolase catalytic domain [Clostridia bacterium]
MDCLKNNFICRKAEYSTAEKSVPMPLFRNKFEVKKSIAESRLTITSLGYYEVHINGKDITKGFMAPYRSNPDHYVFYDVYDIKENLSKGDNVIGVILGNGFQNSIVETWDFKELPWRSAPAVSFVLEIRYDDGTEEKIISSQNTKTFDSPIIFNDFHYGEHYDARLFIPDWDKPCYDDSKWDNAINVLPPRGEMCPCIAEPIIQTATLNPISVTECDGGYIYDFGENNSGLCRIKIKGEKGQKITLKFFETLMDGKP